MAFEHPFLQLLELPTSAAASSVFLSERVKVSLFGKGQIHGVVRADLPQMSLVSALFPTGLGAGKKLSKAMRKIPVGAVENAVKQAGCCQVQTVAAQLRDMGDIRRRLIASAQAVSVNGCGGSLLLVSGGHPFRRFPFIERLLPGNSFEMLRVARDLRQAGDIPAGVKLWAVENPLVNRVDRLEQKILAGAETVIVQPPLLQDRFGDWWDVAHNRGLMKSVPVVVGLPLITSANNLEFWFGLTHASGEQVASRLAQLREVEAIRDVQAKSAFYKEETLRLIRFIKNLPGVAGIHFMPVTPSGWHQFAELEGDF